MSLAAARAAPPALHAAIDVDAAIARYVDAAFDRLRRALLHAAPALVEPTVSDPDRAHARAMYLVDTLEGFAIGDVVGRVVIAARQTMPDADDAIVRAVSEAVALRSRPRREASSLSVWHVPRWQSAADAERKPFIEQLVSQLHVRLCLAGAATRALLLAMIERLPVSDVRTAATPHDDRLAHVRTRGKDTRLPSETRNHCIGARADEAVVRGGAANETGDRVAHVRTRGKDSPRLPSEDDRACFAAALTNDTTIALAFTDQLELGWRFFTAVVEGASDPAIEEGPRWRRARDLWPAWSRRVRGVVDIDWGYILRIH